MFFIQSVEISTTTSINKVMKTLVQKTFVALVLLAFAILNLQFSTAHAQGTTAFRIKASFVIAAQTPTALTR